MSEPCGCIRSPGAITALFATLAAIAFIAQDACLDVGGRVNEWTCETAAGTAVSLWSLPSPFLMGAAALALGAPTYFAVNALVRRLYRPRQ